MSGKLKKIINEDIEKLELFIAHQIPDLSSALVTPIIFLGIMIYFNWKLTLVFIYSNYFEHNGTGKKCFKVMEVV